MASVFLSCALIACLALNAVDAFLGQYPHPGPGDCRDMDVNCGYWARQGECAKNPGWMLNNCPMACGTCACDDVGERCERLERQGQCRSNPQYMLLYCAETCGSCQSECRDLDYRCPQFAAQSYCVTKPQDQYTSWHCRKSCRACIP